MENLRDNNYGYELPDTILELIEKYDMKAKLIK